MAVIYTVTAILQLWKMMIYIVRHGETELNALGVMQGWLDEPLNQAGRNLANITGQELKSVNFDYCISSPLIRSVGTCEIILRESNNQVEITTDDRIKEINFGDLEGKPLAEMRELGKPFFSDPFMFRGFPKGESIQDVCRSPGPGKQDLLWLDIPVLWRDRKRRTGKSKEAIY